MAKSENNQARQEECQYVDNKAPESPQRLVAAGNRHEARKCANKHASQKGTAHDDIHGPEQIAMHDWAQTHDTSVVSHKYNILMQ
jgi:hypothetical protein